MADNNANAERIVPFRTTIETGAVPQLSDDSSRMATIPHNVIRTPPVKLTRGCEADKQNIFHEIFSFTFVAGTASPFLRGELMPQYGEDCFQLRLHSQ